MWPFPKKELVEKCNIHLTRAKTAMLRSHSPNEAMQAKLRTYQKAVDFLESTGDIALVMAMRFNREANQSSFILELKGQQAGDGSELVEVQTMAVDMVKDYQKNNPEKFEQIYEKFEEEIQNVQRQERQAPGSDRSLR